VVPIVTEVVPIGDPIARRAQHLVDPDDGFALPRAVVEVARLSVSLVADLETVQVLLMPPEWDLQCLVNLTEVPGAGENQSTPDRRLDVAQVDLTRTAGVLFARIMSISVPSATRKHPAARRVASATLRCSRRRLHPQIVVGSDRNRSLPGAPASSVVRRRSTT